MLLAERYDTRRYATLAGVLVVPTTIAKAAAPLGAAVLHHLTGSYAPVLTAVAACCLVAAVGIAAAGRQLPARKHHGGDSGSEASAIASTVPS